MTCNKAFQCSIPGLAWKRDNRETAKERLGHVASCPHMTDPRMGQNVLLAICNFLDSVFGDISRSSIIPTGSGVFRGGTFVRLKWLTMCSQYGRWVSLIIPASR